MERLVDGQYDAGGDPSLAFDSQGNVYYCGLGFNRASPPNTVAVNKGTFDGGGNLSWGAPTFINQTTSNRARHCNTGPAMGGGGARFPTIVAPRKLSTCPIGLANADVLLLAKSKPIAGGFVPTSSTKGDPESPAAKKADDALFTTI